MVASALRVRERQLRFGTPGGDPGTLVTPALRVRERWPWHSGIRARYRSTPHASGRQGRKASAPRRSSLAWCLMGATSMTQPRLVEAGDVVFVSARCVQRRFLLKPSPRLTDGIRFLLAHYAKKHDIELYAACVMSSHLHLVYKDRAARGPYFLRDFHRGVALLVQKLHGWQGGVFDQRPFQLRLLTARAIIDKIAYTLANPVETGGVSKASKWPGLWSGVGHSLSSNELRPAAFSKKGRFPPSAELRISVPASLADAGDSQGVRRRLLAALERAERRNRRRVARSDGRFLTPEECLKLRHTSRSRSPESRTDFKPAFSVLGGSASMRKRVRDDYRTFRIRYAEALSRFRAGERDVCFPSGTFQMRWVFGVVCAKSRSIPCDEPSCVRQDGSDGVPVERTRRSHLH